MGNVCGAFWPIAKRHMAQQPAVNVSIRPFKRLNAAGRPVLGSEVCFRVSPTSPLHDLFDFYASTRDIPLALHFRSLSDGELVRGDQTPADLGLEAGGQLDLVAELTPSPPPGGLPPKGLQKVLEYLPVNDAHAVKPTSYCWQGPGRSAIRAYGLRMVKWVAVHGKSSMRYSTVPYSERTDCQAAWAADPNATLRILLTWGSEYPHHAARFLAIVEPSIHGLGRIVRLMEPAHRFVYAKNQMYRWWDEEELGYWSKEYTHTTIEVIKQWAVCVRTPLYFDERTSSWPTFAMERHDLVVSYVSGALRSWTEAAVAADFLCCFFDEEYYPRPVPGPGAFTRGWDDGKASAFAAAYAADVALSRHGPDFSPYLCSQDGFQETAERLEELIQLEERVEDYWSRVDSADGDLLLVEEASQFPGKFY